MPISDEDLAIFRAHMVTKGGPGSGVCPVCKNEKWTVDMAFGGVGDNPLVTTTCTKCFHVRHFAWIPIKAEAWNV